MTNPHIGSSFDDFLREDGLLEAALEGVIGRLQDEILRLRSENRRLAAFIDEYVAITGISLRPFTPEEASALDAPTGASGPWDDHATRILR